MKKVALITGINGQDGSYLAELLIEKNYEVHGIVRRSSQPTTSLIDHLIHEKKVHIHWGDLSDTLFIHHLLSVVQPDELYNLAAQSHVHVSFKCPAYTADINYLGVVRLLESISSLGLSKKTKFYQASTSEMFGNSYNGNKMLDETTPFAPCSPYAIAKLSAFWTTCMYRSAHHMFCANGILFNHESERRGLQFVTRKISRAAALWKMGDQTPLLLGNIDAKRDWGHAKEYVKAMYLMLQQDRAEDYVVATGTSYTVRQFAEWAFEEAGITIEWQGEKERERGINKNTGETVIHIDPTLYRPAEVHTLIGNATKAYQQLGWHPTLMGKKLACLMVQQEIKSLEKPPFIPNNSELILQNRI